MYTIALVLYGLFLLPEILTVQHYKSCSPYPHIILHHGRINHVGRQKYTFQCDKGYFLASSYRVRCYRGNWTSLQEPKCLKIEGHCDDLPPIENGMIFGEQIYEGDKVIYVCKEGFILMGKAERVCSRTGHWSGRTPVCMDESEPLQKVAERLKDCFFMELSKSTDSGPQGRLLDRHALLQGLELVLLIDRSSNVDPVHLEDAKEFIKYILRRFGVRNGHKNKSGSRAAVLAFGTDVQLVFNVDNGTINGSMAANEAVNTIEANGGGTNIEGALTQVILMVTPVLRPNAKKAIFLMTDGEPNIANPEITPQNIASQLKNVYDFEIFTMGIGKGINRRVLAELASEPEINHVFIIEQYPDLNEMVKLIEDSKPEAPPISKDQCGYEAPHEDSPWLATVYLGGDSLRICGGVLMCSQWVLTAASCLEEKNKTINIQDVFVTLGERKLIEEERKQTNYYVTEMRIHPAFDENNILRNNLALLKLNLPATKYRPACLPHTDIAVPLHLDLNITVSISGWGLTPGDEAIFANSRNVQFTMASMPVSLVEEDECPGKQKEMPLVCAGQGSQTCLGLLGSPLIAVDPFIGFNHVIGIAAGRSHCLEAHNQYIELTKHIRWINQQSDGCQLKHWRLEN